METKNQNNSFFESCSPEKLLNVIFQKKAELEFLYRQTEQLKKEVEELR